MNSYQLIVSISILIAAAIACKEQVKPAIEVEKRANVFVQPLWLKKLMASDSSVLIAKVAHGTSSARYIPGSIHINTDEIEYDFFEPRSSRKSIERTTTPFQDSVKGLLERDSLPKNWWNLYKDNHLLNALASMGIQKSTRVVLYGDEPEPVARLFWCLKYAGVTHVHYLNGGIAGWSSAGFQTSAKPIERNPLGGFGADKAVNPQYRISFEELKMALQEADHDFLLVDTRSLMEYKGEFTPYSYIPKKGRINPSLFAGAPDSTVPMINYYNDDYTIQPLDQLETWWIGLGVLPNRNISFSCFQHWDTRAIG